VTEHWLGEPIVEQTENSLEIEQHVQVGNIRARDSITVTRYSDGSVQFAGRGDGPVQVPAHWLPIVNEFLVRSEVTA
jgi:hypothetical protein